MKYAWKVVQVKSDGFYTLPAAHRQVEFKVGEFTETTPNPVHVFPTRKLAREYVQLHSYGRKWRVFKCEFEPLKSIENYQPYSHLIDPAGSFLVDKIKLIEQVKIKKPIVFPTPPAHVVPVTTVQSVVPSIVPVAPVTAPKLNKKQIFFKTVNDDYTSVHAVGKYCKKYEMGQRYVFHPKLPAHVFLMSGSHRLVAAMYRNRADLPEQSLNDHDAIYNARPESVGVRVIVCYGEVRVQDVPVCDIGSHWDFTRTSQDTRFVSDDFVVVGEIKPTQSLYEGACRWALEYEIKAKNKYRISVDFNPDGYTTAKNTSAT